jgi:hypothetical protein
MSLKRDLIISPLFPTILIPTFMAVVFLNNWINPLNPIPPIVIAIILLMLVVWAIVRWSLEPKNNLIKKYKSFMPLITKGNEDIVVVVTKLNLPNCWRYYFDEKGGNLRTAFIDLDTNLNKIINNPYTLLHKKMLLDTQNKFIELAAENRLLYRTFVEMLNTQAISKNSYDYDGIKKVHNQLIDALANSEELKKYNYHSVIIMPLEEPKQ